MSLKMVTCVTAGRDLVSIWDHGLLSEFPIYVFTHVDDDTACGPCFLCNLLNSKRI